MSTLPGGGFGGGRSGGRRKPLVIGGVVLVLIVVWSYVVLSYGGQEQTRSAGPENSGVTAVQTADADERAAVPDEPAYAEGDGEDGSTMDRSGGSTENQRPSSDNDGGDRGRQSEGAPGSEDGSGAHDHAGGATNEPGSYDPLGTGTSEGDLAPLDKKRLRYAAARFVSAAYGYSGSDKDAYNQGVGSAVVWPDFYESQDASEIRRYAKQVENSGTESAARLTDLEITETTPDRATGYAYFETGPGYGKSGAVTGEKQAYRQFMTLARSGSVWKVAAVNEIEETR